MDIAQLCTPASRSRNETFAFELVKYSRCRPRFSSSAQPEPSSALPSPSGGTQEWTHFYQPRLSLVIEITATDHEAFLCSGHPPPKPHQRIRLKITWSDASQAGISSCHPGNFARNTETVLEEVDLNQIVERFPSTAAGQGPLRAVCKDGVAALRYATGVQAGSLVCNRFQIRFRNQNDSLKFIDKIESICSCRIESGSSQDAGNGIRSSQASQVMGLGNTLGSRAGVDKGSTFIENNQESSTLRGTGPIVSVVEVNKCSNPPINNTSFEILMNSQLSSSQNRMITPTSVHELNPSQPRSPSPSQTQTQNQNFFTTAKATTTASNDPNMSSFIHFNEFEKLNDSSLQSLIKEICLEPGFEDFVKRIQKLLSQK